jgi:uncharacterized protein
VSVLVFARAPLPGTTKTRLIPALGAEGAAALQARLIKHTLARVRLAAPGALELHGAPADDAFLRYCAARYDARLVAQSEGDLGERMGHAFRGALNEGRPALVVGTDCPALSARHISQAACALAGGEDAVFVPTDDGGYALVGLARFDEQVFSGVAWSTCRVMRETRERLAGLGWRWIELETLWDVDRPADLERLRASGLLERGAPDHRR